MKDKEGMVRRVQKWRFGSVGQTKHIENSWETRSLNKFKKI